MESKCTNYKANKCAKLLLQEVSIWAYYNGRWSLRACSCPFQQTAHSRKGLREIQCSEVSQCHWTVLGSHLERADWIFLVYCGLLLWIAISSCNSWWGGQVESWEKQNKTSASTSSMPSTLYKRLAHTQRPPEQKLSHTWGIRQLD